MKIAVAADGANVSEHFGHCEGFWIFDVEENKAVNSVMVPNPGHKPGFLPVFLAEKGVAAVISGGMGKGAVDLFAEKGIAVVTGAAGDARQAAESYACGELKSTQSVCTQHAHSGECGH